MKKLLTILAAVMLCVCCFAMVGCGVEGEYCFYAMKIGETEYKVGDTIPGLGEVTEDIAGEFKFELAKDGVIKEDGKVVEGQTWEEKDGKVIVSAAGEAVMEFEVDGDKLIMDYIVPNSKLILIKK